MEGQRYYTPNTGNTRHYDSNAGGSSQRGNYYTQGAGTTERVHQNGIPATPSTGYTRENTNATNTSSRMNTTSTVNTPTRSYGAYEPTKQGTRTNGSFKQQSHAVNTSENANNTSAYLEVSGDGFWTKPDTVVPRTQQERRGRSRHCLDLNPYVLNADLTPEQMTGYQVYYRIEELTKQIQENDYSYCRLAQRERSPSPPPIYDETGNRTNTRENRYRKKLDDERIKLIELAMKSLPNYNAPDNYVKPTFFKEKFYVPVDDYKHINFVGLLLGPRGTALKNLQQESGCRIQIRGKGSFKEGRSQEELPKGSMSVSEPLHCLVIADSDEKLKRGLKACEAVIMKAITSPTGQNDLKREQLKELAKLNGTFRDTDTVACPICGNVGHNRFNCPKGEKYLASIQCSTCQRYGHLEQDCFVMSRQKRQLESRFEPHSDSNKGGTKQRKVEIDGRYERKEESGGRYETTAEAADVIVSTSEEVHESKREEVHESKREDVHESKREEVHEATREEIHESKGSDNCADGSLMSGTKESDLTFPAEEIEHATNDREPLQPEPEPEVSADEEELPPPQTEVSADEEELPPPQTEVSDDEELPPPPPGFDESE